jgi:hypothetical protein
LLVVCLLVQAGQSLLRPAGLLLHRAALWRCPVALLPLGSVVLCSC